SSNYAKALPDRRALCAPRVSPPAGRRSKVAKPTGREQPQRTPTAKYIHAATAKRCRAGGVTAKAARLQRTAVFPASSGGIFRPTSRVGSFALAGPAFRITQACGEPFRKSAAHLRIGGDQTTTLVRQPHASRLAETNRNRKTCSRVDGAGGNAPERRDQLQDFTESVPQSPPCERPPADSACELAESARRPGHIVATGKCAQHD